LSLYLNEKDYVSAITLAGAAENILGPLVKAAGKAHSLSGNAKVYAALASNLGDGAVDERQATTALNDARDWLKHGKPGSIMEFDPQARAQEMIERALYNLLVLTQSETELMRRFHEETLK
jgi:hypothetical protein